MNEEITASILGIEATSGGCMFITDTNEWHRVYTKDPLIQSVVTNAFLSASQIKLEIKPGREIHRVMAFESQGQYSYSPSWFQYTLTRIATQYSPENGHRLEAFISGHDGIERQYNIQDRFLQKAIEAALTLYVVTFPESENRIDISLKENEIIKIRIGYELTDHESK